MRMKKCLSILLAVVMIATMITSLPITANAVEIEAASVGVDEDKIFHVPSEDTPTMKDAADKITEKGEGEYVIELEDDIDHGSGISFKGVGVTVTIIGNGHHFQCDAGQNLQAWDGATLILGDGKSKLTLIGGETNDNPGVVYVVGEKSSCEMNDGVTIKDNQTSAYFGGGVTVMGGTFIMNGGTIQNCGIEGGSVCFGGGIAVIRGGYCEMNGGTITGCYARSDYIDEYDPSRCFTAQGGGVFVSDASAFTMNGGTISDCEATNFGGGVAMDITYDELCSNNMGYPKSNATINGGLITNNSADCGGGIFSSGYFYVYADAIRGEIPSGSAPSNPGLIINGGEISENTANDAGGGVFIAMHRYSINSQIHNASIIGNKANNGAGIENFGYWTQLDIDGCTISNNNAVTNGGGILLSTNSSGGFTNLKNTTITGNISGERGAGVYYDTNSKLNISGANIIQNNTYNGKQNNLNILSLSKPVYVNGDLTGSQIGLSDPTLWDDNLSDEDAQAVSTDYLTSGYKTYNAENPSKYFTSDHDTWLADYSDVNTNEVRLVRKKPDYHINNDDIIAASYNDNNDETDDDIFTDEVEAAIGKEIKVGETINSFYLIPKVVPNAQNSCPYIFKGWYYDQDNENDSRPVKFGADKYAKDIYAHWIKVEDVAKNAEDTHILPGEGNTYGGFDLMGVQIRKERTIDPNYNYESKPGGMRFITSLSTKVVNEINALDDKTDIEYGFVTTTDTNQGWINYHDTLHHKLLYVDNGANGIDTTSSAQDVNYFDFAKNINCTSKQSNSAGGGVNWDHCHYDDYLLYTLVVTYEEKGANKDKNILARPYIHYTDANGLERVAYSDYNGNSKMLGGCYTNYTLLKEQEQEVKT